MNNPTSILDILQIGLIVKLFFMVLTMFFLIFTAVVYRQIMLMTQVLDSKISPVVKVIALGQIVAVAILFFLVVLLV